ncbi:MAG: MoxR family ATPase, partial [Dehalococcoidia bacterium]|nr:MoxR family ATPase [Dehalococcoidia bacterium]
LPRPFMVLATQNPVELEGTFPLPEAELDRFLLRVRLGYPSEAEEAAILLRFQDEDPLDNLEPVLTEEGLLEMQRLLSTIHCDDSLRSYVVRLCQGTRDHNMVELGASPRATLSLYWASRAYAAVQGRDYVTPDDVKYMAPCVLSHRIILSSQTRLRGREPQDFIRELIETVPVPV